MLRGARSFALPPEDHRGRGDQAVLARAGLGRMGAAAGAPRLRLCLGRRAQPLLCRRGGARARRPPRRGTRNGMRTARRSAISSRRAEDATHPDHRLARCSRGADLARLPLMHRRASCSTCSTAGSAGPRPAGGAADRCRRRSARAVGSAPAGSRSARSAKPFATLIAGIIDSDAIPRRLRPHRGELRVVRRVALRLPLSLAARSCERIRYSGADPGVRELRGRARFAA